MRIQVITMKRKYLKMISSELKLYGAIQKRTFEGGNAVTQATKHISVSLRKGVDKIKVEVKNGR